VPGGRGPRKLFADVCGVWIDPDLICNDPPKVGCAREGSDTNSAMAWSRLAKLRIVRVPMDTQLSTAKRLLARASSAAANIATTAANAYRVHSAGIRTRCGRWTVYTQNISQSSAKPYFISVGRYLRDLWIEPIHPLRDPHRGAISAHGSA